MNRYSAIFFILFSTTLFAQEYRGNILGKVVDSKTTEPIPSVPVIVVEKPTIGTSSDTNGIFMIRDLQVGTYSLKVSAVGYMTQITTNIVVTTGRTTPVSIRLDESPVQMKEVTAEVSYFARARQMSPVSSNVIDRSEVLRSPGGIQDVQRVAQNLPGVASSTDNINELIVRGGAPFENLTIMDHMEIPSINHYSNEFNSAGPINMVNADMIEDVEFSSGGYPAQYGDKTSSVMSLTVREGNRNKAFASKTAVNMAGAGTLIEGGFADGKGSYILSARNSLLEIIDKTFGISKISLTAVPKYWDLQSKITYDLASSSGLSLNVLYGDSRINLVGDPQEQDELRKNMIDSSSVQTLYPITKQYAAGLNLRNLFGKNGYSNLTLYASGTKTDVDVQEDFDVRARGPGGEVLCFSILNSRSIFSNHSEESFVGAKYEVFCQVHPRHTLSLGLQVQAAQGWSNDVFVAADTSRYDLNRDGLIDTGPISSPAYDFHQHIGFGEASKYFAYASDKFAVWQNLSLTFGLRYDGFTYSQKSTLSPRFSLSYEILPATTTITVAAGRYYQTQPFPYYGDKKNLGTNRFIDNMYADHYVLGFEHILGNGVKLSFETYYKKHSNVAVTEEFVYSSIDTFRSDKILTTGQRYSYGIEFLLEQKQVEDYFGTLSISLSTSRMNDPRIPPLVGSYPSDYDYPAIVTALAGKVVKGARTWLDKAPFFIKYPSYILPFSDEMEISFKYRFQTGRPYTSQEYVTWKQDREGGVQWSHGSWVSTGNENSARYPDYSRLDLQWLSRFYLNGWNMNVYVAMMNVMNTKNIFYENHRSDGTVETVYQFAFFPVFGVEAEF